MPKRTGWVRNARAGLTLNHRPDVGTSRFVWLTVSCRLHQGRKMRENPFWIKRADFSTAFTRIIFPFTTPIRPIPESTAICTSLTVYHGYRAASLATLLSQHCGDSAKSAASSTRLSLRIKSVLYPAWRKPSPSSIRYYRNLWRQLLLATFATGIIPCPYVSFHNGIGFWEGPVFSICFLAILFYNRYPLPTRVLRWIASTLLVHSFYSLDSNIYRRHMHRDSYA